METVGFNSTTPFKASAGRVTRVLLAVILLLICADAALLVSKYEFGHGRLLGLGPMISLDDENNIPSFYSAMSLMLCAALLFLTGRDEQSSGGRDRRGWYGLAAVFTYLSFDEMSALHEKLIEPVRALLHTSGLLHFAWVIPYGIAAVALGIFYLPFVLRLPRETRTRFFLAGLLYLGGAIGFELLGSAEYEEGVGTQPRLRRLCPD